MAESAWISRIFHAQSAGKRSIVRRKIRNVEKYASRGELIAAVKNRPS